jgi:hypothetical protein
MRERKCNQLGCNGLMRPTRQMWDCDGEISNPTCRIFKCQECGNLKPWLDKPLLNGCFGELHLISHSEASALSLMSDPIFYPPKVPQRRRR